VNRLTTAILLRFLSGFYSGCELFGSAEAANRNNLASGRDIRPRQCNRGHVFMECCKNIRRTDPVNKNLRSSQGVVAEATRFESHF